MLNTFFTPSALAIFNFSKDNFIMAGTTVVLGMAMIFVVLSALWGILAIFKLVFAGASSKKQPAKIEKPVVTETTAPAAASAPAQTDDGQLVAILTAAVAAYMADEGIEAPAGGFRVVSFKRVQGGRAWNSK